MSALLIGLLGGAACFGGVLLKGRLGYDDALDAFGVHGVGGILGGLLSGRLRLWKAWNGAGQDGLLLGKADLLIANLKGTAAGCLWAALATFSCSSFHRSHGGPASRRGRPRRKAPTSPFMVRAVTPTRPAPSFPPSRRDQSQARFNRVLSAVRRAPASLVDGAPARSEVRLDVVHRGGWLTASPAKITSARSARLFRPPGPRGEGRSSYGWPMQREEVLPRFAFRRGCGDATRVEQEGPAEQSCSGSHLRPPSNSGTEAGTAWRAGKGRWRPFSVRFQLNLLPASLSAL